MPIESHKPGAQTVDKLPPGLCIYARTGVGKTSMLRTLKGHGIVIDTRTVEGGTDVLEGRDDIVVIPVRTWDEIDDIFWAIMKKDRKQLPTVNFATLRWVCIDSMSGMQVYAKRKVIKERNLDVDPHLVSQQDYGKIGDLMSELVFRFRTLPYMTIFMAQERKHGGGDDGEPMQLGPGVTPASLVGLVPSLMLIGRLTVDAEGTRMLRVQPHPMYVCKCRAKPGRRVPAVIRRPNLEKLLSFMLDSNLTPEELKAVRPRAADTMTFE